MDEYGIERVECKACYSIYRCGGRYGRSALRCHIRSCKKITFKDIGVGHMTVDDEGMLVSTWKLDQNIVRGLLEIRYTLRNIYTYMHIHIHTWKYGV